MTSNAHIIYIQHMQARNYVQLKQMIQLQILLPETLAQLHNLFLFCIKNRGGKEDVIMSMLDEIIRINDMYKIIHPAVQDWMEKGEIKKVHVALTKVVTEISQSGSMIVKPKWITNEFLCFLYMYYKVPIEKWFVLIRNCSVAFQQAIRTFAIYFQVENIHSQIFLLTPITQNDILAACLSGTNLHIPSFLDNETDEFTFQASPPRNVILDDDDVDMLLVGPEAADAGAPEDSLPQEGRKQKKEKEKEQQRPSTPPKKRKNEERARARDRDRRRLDEEEEHAM